MPRILFSGLAGIALLILLLLATSTLATPVEATQDPLSLTKTVQPTTDHTVTAISTATINAANFTTASLLAHQETTQRAIETVDPALLRSQMLEMSTFERVAELPIVGQGSGKIFAAATNEPSRFLQQNDQVEWLVYDSICRKYSPEMFTIRAVSQHAEVWVQNDLGYKTLDDCDSYNLTDNPIHPDAKDGDYITDDAIDNLLEQFETNIWPTVVNYFGSYDSLDGSRGNTFLFNIPPLLTDNGERVIILISNVRDNNFYEPADNPGFIAGFFSPYFESISNRNMLTLDSKQWNIRAGGPYFMYDSTLAHELQHLIHADYDRTETLWVNEGLSEYAEFLVGYRTTRNHGRSKWQERPENSLTEWGDQEREEITADYQIAYLFMMYTAGRLGGDAQALTDLAALTRHESGSIKGFDAWLQEIGSTLTFRELYRDFRLHMLHGGDTNDVQPQAAWNSGYINRYVSPLMTSDSVTTSEFELGHLRESLTFEGYSGDGSPPFGTDYIEIGYSSDITGAYPIYFEGLNEVEGFGWQTKSGSELNIPAGFGIPSQVFYSGHTDASDNFAIFGPHIIPANSNPEDATLTFDQYYNIEDEWDFGFVQVTTDTTGLSGWTSLSASGMQTTTNTRTHPVIKANVPGYSGLLPGWQNISIDLSTYVGEPFMLAFRYATDAGQAGNSASIFDPGWLITNARIGTKPLDYESARSIYDLQNASLGGHIVNFITYDDGYGIDIANVYTLSLTNAQTGTLDLGAIAQSDSGFDEPGERGILMVTSDPSLASATDLIGNGYSPAYTDYRLTNVPPSIHTSDTEINGNAVGFKGVYPSGTVTVSVSIDNIGASPSISAAEPITGVACAQIPNNATMNVGSEIGGASYVTSMKTVAAAFPAKPGVCYVDQIARTHDYTFTMTADPDLQINSRVVVTTLFANDIITTPEQLETDIESLAVRAPFDLSAHAATADSFPRGGKISFTTIVINLDDNPRDAIITFVVPNRTTFDQIIASGTYTLSRGVTENQQTLLQIQETIGPYDTAGQRDYTLVLKADATIAAGASIESIAYIQDTSSNQFVLLNDSASIEGATLYLPFSSR